MRSGIVLTAAALGLTTAFAVPAAASTPQPGHGPDDELIDIVSVNGTGCAPGSVAGTLSRDREYFTVYYQDYTARTGGDSTPLDSRKNCQIALRIIGVHGKTYAVTSARYRGVADVQSQRTAVYKTAFSFEGGPQIGHRDFTLRGSYRDNFQFESEVDPNPVWKPCDADPTFNINTEIRVTGLGSDPTAVSSISVNQDVQGGETYRLQWRACP
jgi:hypothetical protein